MIGLLLGILRAPGGKPGPAWTVPAGIVGAAAGAAGWNALLGFPLTGATSPAFYGGVILSAVFVAGVQAMRATPL